MQLQDAQQDPFRRMQEIEPEQKKKKKKKNEKILRAEVNSIVLQRIRARKSDPIFPSRESLSRNRV
jgi:hypothetical protein